MKVIKSSSRTTNGAHQPLYGFAFWRFPDLVWTDYFDASPCQFPPVTNHTNQSEFQLHCRDYGARFGKAYAPVGGQANR